MKTLLHILAITALAIAPALGLGAGYYQPLAEALAADAKADPLMTPDEAAAVAVAAGVASWALPAVHLNMTDLTKRPWLTSDACTPTFTLYGDGSDSKLGDDLLGEIFSRFCIGK